MNVRLLRVATALLVVGLPGIASAAAPVVPGFERFGRAGTDPAVAVESGLLLLGELGCANCHAAGDGQLVHLLPKSGPTLDKVGERLRPEWIVEYLTSPPDILPGTTMPHALAGFADAERQRIATTITHFLAATGSFDDRPLPHSDTPQAAEGVKIYTRSGCAACHGGRGRDAALLPDQRPLVNLDQKWSPRALDAFLQNPFHLRPSSRMPALPLNDQDRRHLVASLLGSLPAPRDDHRDHVAFNGRVWPVTVDSLPEFETLGAPAQTGPVKGFGVVQLAGQSNGFVAQLDGFLHAPLAGTYHFYLSSDDGSRLIIGDRRVVEHDGIHADSERHGEIVLEPGVHPIRIDYFEAGGNEALSLDVLPPRSSRRSALEYVTPTAADKPLAVTAGADPDPVFAVDPELAEQGRVAFAAVGCANCHELHGPDGGRIRSATEPRRLAELATPDAGCLAADGPRAGVPHYPLDAVQRAAIVAALAWLRSPEAAAMPARDRSISRALTALNCYACHARDGRGGTIPSVATTDDDGEPILKDAVRDALFTSAVQELGDEGRLPPTLSGVGDKLAAGFLRTVLVEGGKDRGAYMHTLMPKWHAAAVEPLATLLAEEVQTSVATPALAGHAAAAIEEEGRGLVGSKALGCIKCHAFAGDKGQSLGVIDMTRFATRLRHDWFLAYVADPQRFRPGTRMPASWPAGKTFYPDILDGTAAGQIEAVWRYLGGSKPRPPIGASAHPIELVPADRPIVYRNFIEGAGARAIGVGYPEQVNLAWDAERLRLALVWRGSFIDAGKHWTGRGQGFQSPLGAGVFTPDAGMPVAVLAAPDAAWPAGQPDQASGERPPAVRFRGYTLDPRGRPAFNWSQHGMQVCETIEPVIDGGKPVVRRTIRLAGRPAGGDVLFRVAAAKQVVEESDGWLRIDDTWRVKVGGPGIGPPATLTLDGTTEVRRQIVWGPADTAEFVEELAW